MYLAIDIGGTKTLITTFTKDGQMRDSVRFKTAKNYGQFLRDLKTAFEQLGEPATILGCVGVPGLVDRDRGIVKNLGNLPWKNEPIARDIQKIVGVPILIENDANLAGLSEAKIIIKDFKKVLYITISTGIGTGIITNGVIDPEFADSEGGHIVLEHDGKMKRWEDFASGRAIEKRFGKQARDIHDEATWKRITKDIAAGMLNLIAIVQPDVIVIGGGVGRHFQQFDDLLRKELKKYELPLAPIPPLRRARRPEEAVLYGCYELARMHDE